MEIINNLRNNIPTTPLNAHKHELPLLSAASLYVSSCSTELVRSHDETAPNGNNTGEEIRKKQVPLTTLTSITGISSDSNSGLISASIEAVNDSRSQQLVYGNELTINHSTITQNAESLSHPFFISKRKTRRSRHHRSRQDSSLTKKIYSRPRRIPILFITLCFFTTTIVVHEVNSLKLNSIEDKHLNSFSNEILSSLQVTTQPPSEPARSTLGDLFKRFRLALSSSKVTINKSTTAVPEGSIIATTAVPTTTINTNQELGQDDSSSKYDDYDAEGCKSISVDESAEATNITDNERLVNLQSCIQGKIRHSLVSATRTGMEVFEKLSLSGSCMYSLSNLMSNLGGIKSFAFKFLDASAKIPSGVMHGLLSDLGDFDQCLSIKSNPKVEIEDEAEEGAYSGKYCLLSVKMNYHVKLEPNVTVPEGIIPDGVLWDELVRNYWTSKSPKGFQIGVCFPSRCTNEDLGQLYKHISERYNIIGELLSCQDNLDLKYQYQKDSIQQIIICTFYALIILTMIGTIIDRYYTEFTRIQLSLVERYSPKLTSKRYFDMALTFKIIRCFSIIKNWKTFMRKDHHLESRHWDSTTNTNSINSFGQIKNSEFTLNEKTSSNRSTIEHMNDTNLIAPSSNSSGIQSMGMNNEKLCQLTVKIQPDVYSLETKQISPLSHLSGLKLFIIFWITLGQSFLYPSANNYQHYRSIIKMNITRDSVWFAATNFTLGIDMLLYMSGFVLVYKLAHLSPKTYQLGNRLSMKFEQSNAEILRLLSKKILRFWPTYLTVIAIAIVLPLIADGPRWPEMVSKRLGVSCRQNWWSNLLFINNYFSESEICLPSSWFVSILMQLFLIGSILIILVRKFSLNIALIVLTILLSSSCALSFCFAYFVNVRAPVIRMDESFVLEIDENIFRLYTNIFNNLGPFLIGMIGGFLLVYSQQQQSTHKNSTEQSSRTFSSLNSRSHESKFKHLLCRASVALFIIIIAILVLSSVFHGVYSPFWSSIYWSLHRVGWAIVTGYIIHNCATGRWQLLNDLLSLSTFIPLSRLVFIIYLVYPMFIHMHSGLVRDGLHVSLYNMLNIYITRIVMTFTTALLIHLLVELPFCSIEEIYLNRWVWRINNLSKNKDPSKCHPLLTVAPVVSLNFQDHIKAPESTQEHVESVEIDPDKIQNKPSTNNDSE